MSILVQNSSPPNTTAMQAAAANKASQEQVGRFLGLKSAEKSRNPKLVKAPPPSVRQGAAPGGVAKQGDVPRQNRVQQGGDPKVAESRVARDDGRASAYTRVESSEAEADGRLRELEDKQDALDALLEKNQGDGVSVDLAHVQEEALESALQKDHDEYIGELDLLALRRVLKRAESMNKPNKLQFYLELLRSMPTQMTELRGVLHSLVTGALSTFK